MRILIVAKERYTRNALSEILGFEGHDVSAADKMEIGMKLAISQPFDVVIADLDLELVEGQKDLDLIKGIRKGRLVIILIAKKRVDIEAYKEKGVFSVLYTPIDLNELIKTLEVVEPQESYTYDYPRPAVTADCVVFSYDDSRELYVLLIQRNNEPFKGSWAFPGGFLEEDETLEECASRELEEETGLCVSTQDGQLSQLGCFSSVDRDPRGRVITIAFFCVIKKVEAIGQDDAREARWFPVSKLPSMAFDHEHILIQALKRLGYR